MAHEPDPRPWIDLSEWQKNNVKLLPEVALKYAGQHVAWSLDGLHIVASSPDYGQLHDKLKEAGIPLDQVVLDYMSEPNVSQL